MKLRPQFDQFNSLKNDLKFQTGRPFWPKTNSAKSTDCIDGIHGLSGLTTRCQISEAVMSNSALYERKTAQLHSFDAIHASDGVTDGVTESNEQERRAAPSWIT